MEREYDGRADNGPVRIRLDLAYLGTFFEGWQVQETLRGGSPPRTVQGELETAVASLYGRHLSTVGAGRTDSGVHADRQVAHFDVPQGAPQIRPQMDPKGFGPRAMR